MGIKKMGKNFGKFWKELNIGNFKSIIGTSLYQLAAKIQGSSNPHMQMESAAQLFSLISINSKLVEH